MKNDDPNRLLDDLLAETAPADFRAGLLDRTLKQVRRKQLVRQWGRGTLAAAVVATAGLLVWRAPVPSGQRPATPPPASLILVSSQPPDPALMVTSSGGSFSTIATDVATLTVTETSPANSHVRELDDDQLFELTKGTPTLLVRHGPHDAELLIVDANDRIVSPGADADQ
jgi:hypothetical protein